jgi:hypothetical protein
MELHGVSQRGSRYFRFTRLPKPDLPAEASAKVGMGEGMPISKTHPGIIRFQVSLDFVDPLSFTTPDKSLAQYPVLRKRGVLRNTSDFEVSLQSPVHSRQFKFPLPISALRFRNAFFTR